ncbi:MAG: tRNA pseudouridine(38-40) synthase TruA [Oscillospiraceae bacterium]|nr:tRNA pseudouridine(38-40) synthase TruA [Oscillospiraceae bacterium]
MRQLALRLSYDGSAYHGWQRQKGLPTVQETLEEALTKLCKAETRALGCGRTDAGVHARKYCAGFRTECGVPADRLPLALNALLPPDIAVQAACEVEPGFHPVFSCRKKEYTYYLRTGAIRDPFERDRVWFRPGELELDRLRAGAAQFLGTHDFAAVRSVGTNVKTTVRTVFDFAVEREGDLFSFRICASGFLYNMARAMVGTVLYVSLGKLRPEEIPAILEAGDRCLAGPTVPPQGLYMTGVWYDGEAGRMMQA